MYSLIIKRIIQNKLATLSESVPQFESERRSERLSCDAVCVCYRTIIYLSVVYAVGQVVMAVSTIHDITDADRDGTPDNFTFHM